MKILVLGSGVVGTTTAYYLAKAGHEVEVIDRQAESARETSYANAGEISPGYSAPWAAPGIPWKAVKWMFATHAPLAFRPKLDPAMWRWMAQMLGNCNAKAYVVNKGRMVRVAEYSRDVLKELRVETGIAYDERQRGTLEVFRNQKQIDGIAKDLTVLDSFGVPYEVLDRQGCVAAEPALGLVSEKILGGLLLPGDETGDCFLFTQRLSAMAQDLGVKFRFGASILDLVTEGGRVTGVTTSEGMFKADATIVALGSYSPHLVRPLGLSLPVYPVKGYSLTLPVTNADAAPVSTVMDEAYKVAVTRLGDRIRVAGMAEICGFDLELREKRRATIAHVVSDLFPQGGDLDKAEFWCGLRPMTPDGSPVIGATAVPGLYLNTGHGTLGWTMACGSARLLADVVSGRTPDISPEGLGIERYAA
ncbi:D-amino acid dehydrogenase small subunit [Rhodoblastus sphagnicola]|uniref:D-amino acid dehydrogenase n=1 Tax=Rhodoblastus sphagnicola TaxID=333368 RepID=A0A2S6ND72_9HYPH|nr:D-amino acid dehydrogenase [Rhodoblastus sphagnicola]MBB4198002.1 D-amino-acid dehydrogenase [Rhodoblastus sphagnicola]PPQ32562.1 D-amino acid dehydrogenase small subunit [Rhodoblastus sphagnicola]